MSTVIKQIVSGDGDAQTIRMVVKDSERGATGPRGLRGIRGPQGIPGPRGYDGVIQYRAGTGINIDEYNIITATGDATAAWGGIQGDIQSQTDLQNALNAKQDALTAGDGIVISDNTISTQTFTNSAVGSIKGSTTAGKISAENDGTGSVNGWSSLVGDVQSNTNNKLASANLTTDTTITKVVTGSGSTTAINLSLSDNAVSTVKIADDAVTAAKIDFSTLGGNYSSSEQDTGYTWVDGKHIYSKTIDVGNLPDTDTSTISHGISNMSRLVKLEGNAYRSSDHAVFPLPFPSVTTANVMTVSADDSEIFISTGSDRSGLNGYVTLYYTKS